MLIGEAGEKSEDADAADAEDVYFSPLAFPLLAGPGALAVVLGLGNRYDSALDYPGFVLGILVASGISYTILAYADDVMKKLGPKGIDVLNRIFGLLVLAIAAELIFHGIADHFLLETSEG